MEEGREGGRERSKRERRGSLRERERESLEEGEGESLEEGERQRDIDWFPPTCTLTEDRTCNLFGVQDDAPTNLATQSQLCLSIFKIF